MALTVTKAAQSITFPAPPDKAYTNPPFNVSATASSGLTVDFTADGDCSVSGTEVTILPGGTCTIIASQAGDDSYAAAERV